MKKTAILFSAFILLTGFLMAGTCFERGLEIPIPEADLNNGGIGAMISGVDVDGDGMLEIYLVNDNWNDGATEIIPRIYKLEWDGTAWTEVWSAVAPIDYQNTWPQLALTDLDGDGKMELLWTPINAGSANPNRVVVYEHAGGDEFGVWDGSLGWQPNSVWTIADVDGMNIRPMDMVVGDYDSDGTLEVVIADRKGTSSGYHFAVFSVDDIPDTGDGSETWTLEVTGLDFTLSGATENKWDILPIGNNLYFFDEVEINQLMWDGAAWQLTTLPAYTAGSPVQSAMEVDLDNDGTTEGVAAIYDWGEDTGKAIVLIQEDGAGGLTFTELANVSALFDTRGPWGGTMGDIDGDGFMDFVFGSRGGLTGVTNAQIFLLRYLGGDITDPTNYEFSVIDQDYVAEGGIFGLVNIANIDDDPQLEVLYTSTASYGGDLFTPAGSAPVVVLDYICEYGTTDPPVDPPVDPPTVGIEQTDAVVDGYKLGQNYPNPFNPTTNITLEIPSDELVTLTIYDMLGHAVKTLVKQNLAQGEYSVTWDGKDNSGVTVPAGTYVYQLKAGDVVKIRKMTYVK